MMTRPLTRRRAIGIAVAAGLVGGAGRRDAPPAFEWRGSALGGTARIAVDHPDSAWAVEVGHLALAEIDRLEDEFSLFRADSALSRLNRDGRLAAPSIDMRRLALEAIRFASLSNGLFDPTVQPVWQALAARHGGTPRGATSMEDAIRLVNWRGLHVDDAGIRFARVGMAATFNAIAQGYIADRVAALLTDAGFDHVLVDTGEIRVVGSKRGGAPWRIGGGAYDLTLTSGAVATSQGGRSPFVADGSINHLLDPSTGLSPPPAKIVAAVAEDAATADALSTILCLAPEGDMPRLLAAAGGRGAILTRPDGSVRHFGV